jgi:hypothetical protein
MSLTYRTPQIADLGNVVTLTKGTTTPVSENGHNPDDGYYDAANDPTGPAGPVTISPLDVDDLE